MPEENRVTVYIKGGNEINLDFEAGLRTFFEKHGFEWTGQGTDLEDNIRDICFKKVKEE